MMRILYASGASPGGGTGKTFPLNQENLQRMERAHAFPTMRLDSRKKIQIFDNLLCKFFKFFKIKIFLITFKIFNKCLLMFYNFFSKHSYISYVFKMFYIMTKNFKKVIKIFKFSKKVIKFSKTILNLSKIFF